MRFAAETSVSPERSQEQIRSTLRKYGAGRFGLMEDPEGESAVIFEIKGLTVRIGVPMPDRAELSLYRHASGKMVPRTASAAASAYDQAVKQRWRALLLAIKAKLEAVECGISTLEREFLPFVVMPDGRVLADHVLPALGQMVVDGKMPKLLTAT